MTTEVNGLHLLLPLHRHVEGRLEAGARLQRACPEHGQHGDQGRRVRAGGRGRGLSSRRLLLEGRAQGYVRQLVGFHRLGHGGLRVVRDYGGIGHYLGLLGFTGGLLRLVRHSAAGSGGNAEGAGG